MNLLSLSLSLSLSRSLSRARARALSRTFLSFCLLSLFPRSTLHQLSSAALDRFMRDRKTLPASIDKVPSAELLSSSIIRAALGAFWPAAGLHIPVPCPCNPCIAYDQNGWEDGWRRVVCQYGCSVCVCVCVCVCINAPPTAFEDLLTPDRGSPYLHAAPCQTYDASD